MDSNDPIQENSEYRYGEILKKDKAYYVIMTPSCDFQMRSNGTRNVEVVVLFEAFLLKENGDYVNYYTKRTGKSKLLNLMHNKLPRYHYLPGTSFISDLVIDFQKKKLISYDDLQKQFERIAILDSPFAESLLSRHIAYYSRIGTPDLDIDYIINDLCGDIVK